MKKILVMLAIATAISAGVVATYSVTAPAATACTCENPPC